MSRAFLFAAALAAASPASAASFSFTGSFAADDNVQLFNFTVGALSDVVLHSFGYAGGTLADGTVINAGGFDPILALFDGTGQLINQNDDGGSPNVIPDPVTGATFDTYLAVSGLAAGNYTASVMEFDNFASGPNLSNGFAQTGNPTFTSTYGCSNGQFCDVTGANRTNKWAFDILGVESADVPTVPLPAGLPLLGGAIAGLAALRRRSRAS